MLLGRSRSCRIIRVSLRYCHRLSPSSSSSTSSSTHTVHSISINCNVHLYCFFFFFLIRNLIYNLLPKVSSTKTKEKERDEYAQVTCHLDQWAAFKQLAQTTHTNLHFETQLIEVCTQDHTISRNNSEKHSLTHIEKRRELLLSITQFYSAREKKTSTKR